MGVPASAGGTRPCPCWLITFEYRGHHLQDNCNHLPAVCACRLLHHRYLAHPPLIIFVYPVIVACSFAHFVFNLFEVYPNNRLDQWPMGTIMAAICGTIAGIGLITGVVITKERLSSKPSAARGGEPAAPDLVLHCNAAALG